MWVKQIRIKSFMVKECEYMDNKKTKVLHLKYKIGWLDGEVNLKDYDKKYHNKYLTQIKKAIREWYEKYILTQKENETNERPKRTVAIAS